MISLGSARLLAAPKRLNLWILLSAGTIFTAQPGGAFAQEPASAEQTATESTTETDSPAARESQARALFEEGRTAFDAQSYDEALAAFEEAYSLHRVDELLFNIASSHDRLGNVEQAVTHYRAYLATSPSAENQNYVNSRLALLEPQIEEEGVEEAPRPTPTDESDEAAEETAVVAPEPEESGRSMAGPATLIAIGGAALAAGAVTGAMALSQTSDLESPERCGPERVCMPSDQGDVDRLQRLSLATDVLLIAGGAVALGGIIWWVAGGGDDDEDVPPVTAACSTTGCRADLRLSF